MKVSLVNLNLVAEDAIGACIMSQARLFRGRGDDVRVYTSHPPERVPADIEALTQVVQPVDFEEGRREHFRLSDLYIYHYPGRYELMESIRNRDRGTVILYYHNVTPPELWGTDIGRDELQRDVDGSSLVHHADLCITPSPFNKEVLVDRFGYAADRVYVLPLAVSLDHFTPGDKPRELVRRYGLEGQQVLLFVGRMAGNKRIDLLIEALARVKRHLPDTKLLLVGDDQSNPAFRPIVASARRLAVELGVAQDVTWTGRVDSLPPYLRLADLYVTASLHEGFGLPLIEAMACGTPVVASRAGAMPWVLDDAGLLFEPGDAEELAEQVVTVLQDDSLRQTLTERGIARSQEFSLRHYEAGLTEIVDAAVTYTMPVIPAEPAVESSARPDTEKELRARQALRRSWDAGDDDTLGLILQDLEGQSDIAMRGYVVRSKVPVLGPLITWARRNLTSHLREPYLDPMIERQVAFNHRVTGWIRQAVKALGASAHRQEELEARMESLEAQVESLTRRLSEETDLE
ncbi:MAG: glycosyltransferase family 4 protein [Anaerolineae bacterium]|jgi:glycosyltransferase involved in cell wall biosynthesis